MGCFSIFMMYLLFLNRKAMGTCSSHPQRVDGARAIKEARMTLSSSQIWSSAARSDHFRFGSVFTFKKQPNRKAKKKGTQTEPEPVQTDRFRFDLGPVFWVQNRKNLWLFFWLRNELLVDF